jgi:hypothetical protein
MIANPLSNIDSISGIPKIPAIVRYRIFPTSRSSYLDLAFMRRRFIVARTSRLRIAAQFRALGRSKWPGISRQSTPLAGSADRHELQSTGQELSCHILQAIAEFTSKGADE